MYTSPSLAAYPDGTVCERTLAPFGSVISGVATSPSFRKVATATGSLLWSVTARRPRRLRLVAKAPAFAVSVEAAERVVAEVVAVESATGLFADAFKG